MPELKTFHATDILALPGQAVRDAVAEHGVACIRGLFDREEIRRLLFSIAQRFDPSLDAKHDPRDIDAIRRNFQKLQIGANSGVDSRRTLGRFMRVFYNPIFAEDIYGLRPHFVALAQLRNVFCERPIDFAIRGMDDDGYWTCARLQQYPAGGGFMVPHRDQYARVAANEGGYDYYQLLLQLTEKGPDFTEGGAYVDRGEERFPYEAFCQSGDVVVYDGRSIHGVADIDPMAPLDLTHFNGRVVAMASLFRVLKTGEDYARIGEKAREWYGSDEAGYTTS